MISVELLPIKYEFDVEHEKNQAENPMKQMGDRGCSILLCWQVNTTF
jgi:hypothetical protein